MSNQLKERIQRVNNALLSDNPNISVQLTSIYARELGEPIFGVFFKDDCYWAQLRTHIWKIEEHHRFIISELV